MARSTEDDLEDLSVRELRELSARIDELIVEKRVSEQKALKEELAARAEELGFSVEELFGERQKRKYTKRSGKTGSVDVKYRNPDNPNETWSGRGRMAKWLAEKIKKRGVTLEDFAV